MEQLNHQKYKIAERMIYAGARSPTIAQALGLSIARARKMHKFISNRSSTSGQSPWDAKFFLGPMVMQSSAFANLFDKVCTTHPDDMEAERVLRAYISYILIYGSNAQIPFDRAWNLTIHMRTKKLKLVPCRCCSMKVIVSQLYPRDITICPICDQ
ncbi:MAG: hypothetical protein KGI54_04795 [Pseudomonadota bacterium]|nr:hypothetical protein [Pseudomonadota bacterium]